MMAMSDQGQYFYPVVEVVVVLLFEQRNSLSSKTSLSV